MKKFIVVILTFLTVLCASAGLVACGGSGSTSGNTSGNTSGSTSGNTSDEQPTTIQYTVSFYDEEGKLLESKKWDENSTPSYSYNKQDTEDWDYTFEGWAASQNGNKLTALPKVTANVSYYAVVSKTSKLAGFISNLKGYVAELSGALKVSAYDYLPEAMSPAYSANLVEQSSLVTDYTDFVNVSNINYGGFGAQWNMIVDNINKTDACYKSLSTVNSVVSVALTAVNDYLSTIKSHTIDIEKSSDKYTLRIAYTKQALTLFVQYKTNIQNSQLGSVAPTVEMVYGIENGEKSVSVKFSDTNAIRYIVSENKFEFGLSLGRASGNYTSYCYIENKNGVTEGKINEFISVAGKEVKSAAEFHIDDTYVTAVGNKADSILGFKGYVCEVYKKSEGKLLGFEVKEDAGVVEPYNTLWFNLNDISGITSVKIGEKQSLGSYDKRENSTYLNGRDTLLAPTYNKQLGIRTSRKYDVEMKLRYFYGINAETGEPEKYEVQVPMMFIQEDNKADHNYTDYPANMLEDNGINSQVTMNSADLAKVMAEYDEKIDVFIGNKENTSGVEIKAFIGLNK